MEQDGNMGNGGQPGNGDGQPREDGRTTPVAPAFTFPKGPSESALYPTLSLTASPHGNSPPFPYASKPDNRKAKFIASSGVQPNIGIFKKAVVHRDEFLANLHPSQLAKLERNPKQLVLIAFRGGQQKLKDEKPGLELSKKFAPLLLSDKKEMLRCYDGLPHVKVRGGKD